MAKGKASVVASKGELPTLADLLNASITSTKLAGSSSYIQWCTAIKTFLISKDKLHYIEEEFVGELDAKWIKVDVQVCSWLWNSMEPYVSADVILLNTAYLVLSSVSDSFASNNNVNRIFELCEEIFGIK